MNDASLSVVLLTYRRPEMLRRNVARLLELDDVAELIVVDNDPESQDDLASFDDPRLVYRRVETNGGAVARGEGMAAARGEIVVTLDDDVLGLDAGAIRQLRTAFAGSERLGAVCFKVLHPQTGRVMNWCHHRDPQRFAGQRFETYEISEGAVAFRRAALDRAGTYPRSFFISHEGLDLACRLMQRGYVIEYLPGIVVEHHQAPQGRSHDRRYYYDTRNQIWIAARNLPLGMALGYLSKGLTSMALYALRDGYLRTWVRAVRDGLRGLPREWREREVIDHQVRSRMREIDRQREGTLRLIRKRLFRRGVEI